MMQMKIAPNQMPAKAPLARPEAPVTQMQSASMAQNQVQALSPQLPGGSVGFGGFKRNYMNGQMDQNKKFQAMQNLVSGKYAF